MDRSSNAVLPLHFTGQTALVTGAGSGIGEAITGLLIQAGVTVYAVDQYLPTVTPGALPMAADVRNSEQLDRLFETLPTAPEYVVNSAGVLDPTGFTSVPDISFARVLDINLTGAYRIIDRARIAGALRSVVNITSIEGFRVVALSNPDPHPAYAASKAALSMLTRTAARAMAGRGTRVNSIAPGFVRTPMAQEHGDPGELPTAMQQRIPLQRFASPAEVAHSVVFLLSDEAAYITGTELTVDGGFSLT